MTEVPPLAHASTGIAEARRTLLAEATRSTAASRRAYRAVLALVPGDAHTLMSLGTLAAQTGDAGDLALLRRVSHLDPERADGHANYGSALLSRQDLPSAQPALRRALALQPDLVTAWYNEGLSRQQAGEIRSASTAYRRAVAASPCHVEARRNLAVCLHSLKEIDEALRLLQSLVRETPDRADIRENIAFILLDIGRTDDAFEELARAAETRYGLASAASGSDPALGQVTPVRLKHDREQLDHLLAQGHGDAALRRLRDTYAGLLEQVPPTAQAVQALALSREQSRVLAPWYGRRYARREAFAVSGSALNPSLDLRDVERRYLNSTPEITVIDGLLSDASLLALRRFCLENSFWIRSYGGGYLGSFMEDGFVCPLIAQIAGELRAGMSRVVGPHPLKKVWGFKYDSRLSGINLHADFAAVNVNFWIMPDSANRDPSSGGLIIWDKPAPLSWGFEEYNRSPELARRYLDGEGAKAITVPYRANRAVIFNSNLFHETDRIDFKDGYENRRINITLLYGTRS